MPQRPSPNSRPLRSRIKMTFGSKNLTSNVQGQRQSQVKCPSRCFRHRAKALKTRNPESHAKMSSDTGLPVSPLGAAPDRRSLRRLDSISPSAYLAKWLSRHSATRQMRERTQPKIRPPIAASAQTRLPNLPTALSRDPCPCVRARTAVSAHATLAPASQRTIRRLGADQRATFRGLERYPNALNRRASRGCWKPSPTS